jgi:hypothetical protein
MIARPGRPGIHDGTEFALQGFKNRSAKRLLYSVFQIPPEKI